MNLDQSADFPKIDRENMYQHIENLPDQLDLAWRVGLEHDLPDVKNLSAILVSGMGGSAIGADLLSGYVSQISPVPVFVHRDYALPGWAQGGNVLVISSSHSGDTEETLSSYVAAKKNGCSQMVVCTGGKLAEMAENDGIPTWLFMHKGQPRAAVGFSFGLLLALMYRLKLIPNPYPDLQRAVELMEQKKVEYAVERSLVENPAKKMALRLNEKWVVIYGADFLAPVARRWKGQMSELAKSWAQFEFLPEADHNTLAGTKYPKCLLSKMKAIFLSSQSHHPRNHLRIQYTAEAMEQEGLDVEILHADGHHPLEDMWSLLHLGDYVSYYLALINNVDPTPIDIMTDLKKALLSS